MAYQQSFTDDEEEKKQQGGGTEQVISSESSSLGSAPGSAPSPTSAPSKKGSGFTNLMQYVNANRDQSAGMAEKVTGNIDNQIQGFKSGTQAFQTEAQKTAQDNTVQDQGVVNALNTSPQKFAEKQWQDLFKQQTQGYKGPTQAEQFTQYQPLDQQYKNIDQSVKALNTNEGRAEAARTTFSPLDKQYTRGENILDTFLLGSGGGAQKLNQFQQGYQNQNVGGQWQDLIGSLNNQFSQAKATTDKTKADTEAAYGTAKTGLEGKFQGYQQQLDSEKKDNAAKFDLLTGMLTGKSWGDRQNAYKQVGIDPAQAEWLRSNEFDLGRLVNQNAPRGLGDVASKDDIAGLDAILGLTGAENPYTITTTGNAATPFTANQGLIDQAGQAYGLKQDITSRLSQAQSERDRVAADALQAVNIPLSNRFQKEGLSPKELDYFSNVFGLSGDQYLEAANRGLINPNLIKKGVALNTGDVATDAERQQWANLMQALGIVGDMNLQDIQDEGDAYSVDTTSLLNSIIGANESAARAKIAQEARNEEKRKLDAEERLRADKALSVQPGTLQFEGGPVNPRPLDPKEMEKNKKKAPKFADEPQPFQAPFRINI